MSRDGPQWQQASQAIARQVGKAARQRRMLRSLRSRKSEKYRSSNEGEGVDSPRLIRLQQAAHALQVRNLPDCCIILTLAALMKPHRSWHA